LVTAFRDISFVALSLKCSKEIGTCSAKLPPGKTRYLTPGELKAALESAPEWLDDLPCEATFTNVLNHTNFAPPATDISSPSSFGALTTAQTAESAGTGPDRLLCGLISKSTKQTALRRGRNNKADFRPRLRRSLTPAPLIYMR
jgi:hypothetical protein